KNFLEKLHYESSDLEPCFFVRKGNAGIVLSIVIIYVDDIFGSFRTDFLEKDFYDSMFQEFGIRRESGEDFLGITINRKGKTVSIDQKDYVTGILEKFNMDQANPTQVPFPAGLELSQDSESKIDFPYRELIGSLL